MSRGHRMRMVLPDNRVFVLGPETEAAFDAGGAPAIEALLKSKGIDLSATKRRRLP